LANSAVSAVKAAFTNSRILRTGYADRLDVQLRRFGGTRSSGSRDDLHRNHEDTCRQTPSRARIIYPPKQCYVCISPMCAASVTYCWPRCPMTGAQRNVARRSSASGGRRRCHETGSAAAPVEAFGCRPMPNPTVAARAGVRKPSGKEPAGSRAPGTAQRYEDFAPAIGMRAAGGKAREVRMAARQYLAPPAAA
jgi:hypothetical protein